MELIPVLFEMKELEILRYGKMRDWRPVCTEGMSTAVQLMVMGTANIAWKSSIGSEVWEFDSIQYLMALTG
jgi:hypothetical protein